MKASELRIGNYFNPIDRSCKIHLPVDIVFEIKYFLRFDGVVACKPDENIATIKQPFEFSFNDMSLIPLTEEWLLKFGFIQQPWGWVMDDILIRWSKSKNDFTYWVELGNGKRIYFKHVHVLQNFFALTGKELEIKPAKKHIDS